MAGSWHMVNRNPYLIEGADAAKGKGRWETIRVIDPNDPEHKHVIEKKIHHERYAGEDQWRGMCTFFGLYIGNSELIQ